MAIRTGGEKNRENPEIACSKVLTVSVGLLGSPDAQEPIHADLFEEIQAVTESRRAEGYRLYIATSKRTVVVVSAEAPVFRLPEQPSKPKGKLISL